MPARLCSCAARVLPNSDKNRRIGDRFVGEDSHAWATRNLEMKRAHIEIAAKIGEMDTGSNQIQKTQRTNACQSACDLL